MNRITTFLLLCSLLVGIGVQAAPVLQTEPALSDFSVDAENVSRGALENRSARLPVSWSVANRPVSANLFFEQVLADGSVVNVELPRTVPWVASAGQGIVAPIAPAADVNEITLQLRLVDLVTQQVYDAQQVTLPVVAGEGGNASDVPAITHFTAASATIQRDVLSSDDARISVNWAVSNRPQSANLIFEQVLPGTGTVNVELPRDTPWVNSEGSGVVAPRYPGDDVENIWLRVRLIDLVNGRVYDQRDLFVSISDEAAPAPQITAFSTTATSANRAELAARTARIPVSWAVENRPADSNLVFEQVLADGSAVNVELPRQVVIVPSSGNGIAAAVDPGTSASEITLRVRLVSLSGETEYAAVSLKLPVAEAPVQQAAITAFASSASSISRAQLANASARVPVTWAVENRPANSNLVFEQVLPNGNMTNVELPRQVVIVPSSGNGTAAPIAVPDSTNEIVLQVRLINLSDNSTIASRQITLPIVTGSSGAITSFTTTATGVDAAALSNRSARIPVTWTVENRPQNSNLIFEQRLANGNVINVELPRSVPIVPSSGTGVTNPSLPGGNETDVLLVLRLVDLSTNQTLDSKILSVPILNLAAPITPPVDDTTPDQPGDASGHVRNFSASPATVAAGGTVSLSWDVQNAGSVVLIPVLPGGVFGTSYENLPLNGTQQHPLSADVTDIAPFILSVRDDAGREIETASVLVTVSGAAGGDNSTDTDTDNNTAGECAFSGTYRSGCPESQTAITASYQPFQNGVMVRRSDTGQIYALFNNGSYLTFNDTWQEGNPVDTGETPPGGLYLPVRGLGNIWANERGVRDELGWATAPQSDYATNLEIYVELYTMDTIVMGLPDGRTVSIGMDWAIE